jgi:glutamine---fructose-6-phosphate transaminase (isomerizing)
MCGIVGYIGPREAAPHLVAGLRRMEYRGYDSAGVATLTPRPVRTQVRRARGRVEVLADVMKSVPTEGHIGLAHTRWATHGAPRVENAHPHHVDGVTVVHNGIFENAAAVRAELLTAGRHFASDTDTEVLAHLVAGQDRTLPLVTRLFLALGRLSGSWAVAVIDEVAPDGLAFARLGSPLVLGRGDQGMFLASDPTALAENVHEVLFLEDGDIGAIVGGAVQLMDRDGSPVSRSWVPHTARAHVLDRGPHAHHMRSEIDEQPRAIRDTLWRAFTSDELAMPGLAPARLSHARRLVLTGCGSSHHAAQVVARAIEDVADLEVRVELASEWRHHGRIEPDTLVVGISQSGETADTLGALEEARRRGADIAAITNVEGSAITRLCAASGGAFVTAAGPEIGVASTKAFVTQIVALRLLGFALAQARGRRSSTAVRSEALELLRVATAMRVGPDAEARLRRLADEIHRARTMLYLGRGAFHALALEGALKMTEVSYIHAQGFAAGEMKHGPIALIEAGTPVVVLAPRGPLQPKVLSNLAEVKARGARVIVVSEAGDTTAPTLADDVIAVEDGGDDVAMALKMAVPLQLLAYFVALRRGLDADMPRNLAKSVTVE